MNKKIIYGILIGVTLIVTLIGFNIYQKIYGTSSIKQGYVYISTNASMEEVAKQLQDFVKDSDDFLWVAKKKKFTKSKAGRYKISEKMSNNDIVNLLRSGQQEPINLSFNNQHTIEKLAGRISQQIEADSLSILNAIKDANYNTKNNIKEAHQLGYFIPNSYQFFWNSSGEQFRDRMHKEYQRFWNRERSAKARALGMTQQEVISLASIVQKETAKVDERPVVAGLYINRLKRRIPLQADPTIVFALKQQKGQDFAVKRVLYKDLKIKSPYNTYTNRGLPPGLIAMPDISAIDAVLNYKSHNYLYMCASVENVGYHAFATNLAQHNRNARKYQQWLNKRGINR